MLFNGVVFLSFLTYVVYHVISKLRGNEKNQKMNTYGIGLAVLGIVFSSVYFADSSTAFYIYSKKPLKSSNYRSTIQWEKCYSS